MSGPSSIRSGLVQTLRTVWGLKQTVDLYWMRMSKARNNEMHSASGLVRHRLLSLKTTAVTEVHLGSLSTSLSSYYPLAAEEEWSSSLVVDDYHLYADSACYYFREPWCNSAPIDRVIPEWGRQHKQVSSPGPSRASASYSDLGASLTYSQR